MLRYTKEVGDYTISLKMPEYLGSGGFVSIAKTSGYVVSLDGKENIIESSEMYITLYIYLNHFIAPTMPATRMMVVMVLGYT